MALTGHCHNCHAADYARKQGKVPETRLSTEAHRSHFSEKRLLRHSADRWPLMTASLVESLPDRWSMSHPLFFRSLQLEGVFPDNQTVRIVFLRHADAAWQPDLSDLPDVCRTEDPPLDSPTAVVERIAEISTRFWLASACDRQLLQVAATKVVAQHQQEIVEFLEGRAASGATP